LKGILSLAPSCLLCILAGMRWAASATHSCHYDSLPYLRYKAMDPVNHGLKPLKLGAPKKSLLLLNCFSQAFVTVMKS
jgi:hypothetical protein